MDPSRYIPMMLLLYSWGSLFGAPIKGPFILKGTSGCFAPAPVPAGATWFRIQDLGFRV